MKEFQKIALALPLIMIASSVEGSSESERQINRYNRMNKNIQDVQNVVCIRVKTAPDFWVKNMNTGLEIQNRTSPDFLYKYVVEVKFTENDKPRAYSINLPIEGGISERSCFPKGSKVLSYKSNSSVLSNLSATVKAVPIEPIQYEKETDYTGMYRPALDLKMKTKHIINKKEQPYPCTPFINGPLKLDNHLVDDIVITVGNDKQDISWQVHNTEKTREGKSLDHYMTHFYPQPSNPSAWTPISDSLIQLSNSNLNNKSKASSDEGTIFSLKYEGAIESIWNQTPLVPLSCGIEVSTQSPGEAE